MGQFPMAMERELRRGAMTRVLMLLGMLGLSGCTTVHEWGNGRVVVPHVVEVRSPFGTNAGFVMIEDCEGSAKPDEGLQPLFPTRTYTDCRPLTGWVPVSSQGQGGQITQGVLIGAGTVGLGAVMPAASGSVNAVSSSSAAATANMPGAHK